MNRSGTNDLSAVSPPAKGPGFGRMLAAIGVGLATAGVDGTVNLGHLNDLGDLS